MTEQAAPGPRSRKVYTSALRVVLAILLLELGGRGVLAIKRTFFKEECWHPNALSCNAQPFQSDQAEALLSDPFTGWAWLPEYKGEWLSINSLGLRGSDIAVEKPEGTLRIAIVGGSAAFGVGVHDNETIGAALEAILEDELGQPVEVLNGAVTSFNTSQELSQILVRLLPLNPDIMIEYGGRNDAYFALSPQWEPHYTSGLRGLQVPLMRPVARPFDQTVVGHYLATQTAFGVAIGQGIRLIAPNSARSGGQALEFHPEAIRVYQQNIERMAELLDREGVKLIVINQPSMTVGNKPLTEQEETEVYYTELYDDFFKPLGEHYPAFAAALQETAARMGVPAYDFTTIFDHTRDTVYLDEAHLTPLGNRIVAERLAEIILEMLQ